MFRLKEFFLRLKAVLQSNHIEREIDEELRFHIEMRTRENLESGMKPADARREALRRFGNFGLIKDLGREVRGGGMLEVLLQDLRYGARMLFKQPVFTVTAILTLALGIGANTIVFSVVNAVLLRPLPFKDPEKLVLLGEVNQPKDKKVLVSSTGDFVDWRNQNQSLEDMAGYFNWSYNLIGAEEPERLNATVVTGNFFQVLGVNARIGRVIIPDDDQAGKDGVVVLSYGFWQRRFAGNPNVVGDKLTLNTSSYTVVGVLSAGFKFPSENTDIWVPAGFDVNQLQSRRGRFMSVIARLKPGISVAQAQTDMTAVAARIEQEHPDTNTGWTAVVSRLSDVKVGDLRPIMFILLGAVAFVLLIACVNVANLLLARAAARRREFAVRTALGASRARLVRQLLTESFLLSLLGGVLGVLLAWCGISLITAINPGNIPRLAETSIDARVLGFTLAVSVISVLLFGLAPALFASQSDPQKSLNAEGRGSTGAGQPFRNALVVAEIAVALVLLIGGGLMIKSFLRLQAVDPGFNPDKLLTFSVSLPASRYPDNDRQIAFFQQLVEQVGTIPGMRAVGAIQDLPMRRNRMGYNFLIEGQPLPAGGNEQDAAYRAVTPGYFQTMGIPVLSGRQFTAQDGQKAPPVVIINQSLVREYWPDENPIGKRLRLDDGNSPWLTIVGIVGDVKHMGLDAEEGPALYQPHAQKPEYLRWMTFVARTTVEPLSLANSVRSRVLSIDKDQPVFEIVPMEQLVSRSVASPRFYALLFALFAFIALVLAAVGVYGVLAFWVTQRTKEIGIHLALGAQRKDVMQFVLAKGLTLALIGVGAGLAGAFILTRVMIGLLYQTSSTDPVTFLVISLLLAGVALLACLIPARRATHVDPMIALRYE